MVTVNQMTPLSGEPKRFSFDMETTEKTTQLRPRNTISHRLKAIIVSSGCTRFGLVALFVLDEHHQQKLWRYKAAMHTIKSSNNRMLALRTTHAAISPARPIEQGGDRYEGVLKNAEMSRTGSKSGEMAGPPMPQL
jgi:hypothetical protein